VRTLDHRGRPVRTGYVVDVTVEHELQQRLTRAARARNLMLATAGHELRAPPHNPALALQRIDPQRLDADTAGALRAADGAARTLTLLIDDVLDRRA
jgi:signal transduction histidine kinase